MALDNPSNHTSYDTKSKDPYPTPRQPVRSRNLVAELRDDLLMGLRSRLTTADCALCRFPPTPDRRLGNDVPTAALDILLLSPARWVIPVIKSLRDCREGARVQIGDAKKNHRIQHHGLFLNFMRIANTEIPAPTSKSVDGSGVGGNWIDGRRANVPCTTWRRRNKYRVQESGHRSRRRVTRWLATGPNDGGRPYSKTSGGGSRGGAFGASGGSSNAMRLPQRHGSRSCRPPIPALLGHVDPVVRPIDCILHAVGKEHIHGCRNSSQH